jgi:predicted transposase YbfD/YdcC
MDTCQYGGLTRFVLEVPDPRDARGRTYAWSYLLAVVVAAVAAACCGPLAIFEWICNHREPLQQALGEDAERIPSVSTLQRVLRCVDVERLEEQVEAHNRAVVSEAPPESPVLPLDGKWARTASAHGEPVILLTLATPDGIVVRQRRVPAGTNEEACAPALLAGMDLEGKLVTADAGITSKKLARRVIAQGGDYLLAIKGDTPALYGALVEHFNTPPSRRFDPVQWRDHTREKGHGRIEERRLEASWMLNEWLDEWPRLGLALRRWTRRKDTKTGRWSDPEETYALTSLTLDRATPAALLRWWRDHWAIENRVFYVRDVTLGEDRCAVWRGSGPQALAALRNGVVARLRLDERFDTVKSGFRWAQANAVNAMQLVGIVSTMT